MADPTKSWASYISSAVSIMRNGMSRFVDYFSGIADMFRDAADTALENIQSGDDLEGQIDMLHSALNEIENEAGPELPGMFSDYANELTGAAGAWSQDVGIQTGFMQEIGNQMSSQAYMNNYSMIQGLTPQLKADIMKPFTDALATGQGPGYIEEQLRDVGLQWSATGRFSPGQRAAMIASTEYVRIREELNRRLAAEADLDWCVNHINRSLVYHADVCIAATAKGLMTLKELDSKYGQPPRHPRCGCKIEYTHKEYYDKSDTTDQLNDLSGDGFDWKKAASRWEDKGGLAKVDSKRRADAADWDKKAIDRIN